ncbi:tetratricopeptide repeat protein [Motilimonas sp. KMU-193]|uniref:tetratricopeptide repeat protein n=1 Tax=Motilimonas sp. KMU-193 TaxID=3388668 RepID=UPI00396AFE72
MKNTFLSPRLTFAVLPLAILLSGCAVTDESPRGADSGRCDIALEVSLSAQQTKQCRQAAEQGDAQAQYRLGMAHVQGELRQANLTDAAKWFRLASEHGYGAAKVRLAEMYLIGQGVEQDDSAGVALLHEAAELENPEAMFVLSEFYRLGEYVPKDSQRAIQYLQASARYAWDPARALYGAFLIDGRYVEQDIASGIHLVKLAASNQDPRGLYFLGLAYYEGKGVLRNESLARTHLQQSAELSYLPANMMLIEFAIFGIGGEANAELAIALLEQGVESGHAKAIALMDKIVQQGGEQPSLAQMRLSYYLFQAEHDSNRAKANLAILYADAESEYYDLAKARAFLADVEVGGDPVLLTRLYFLAKQIADVNRANEFYQALVVIESAEAYYLRGMIEEEDKKYAAAAKLYRKAAYEEHPLACRALGEYYFHGISVEKSLYRAEGWFKLAAKHGDLTSQLYLAKIYEALNFPSFFPLDEAYAWLTLAADNGLAKAQSYRTEFEKKHAISDAVKQSAKAKAKRWQQEMIKNSDD